MTRLAHLFRRRHRDDKAALAAEQLAAMAAPAQPMTGLDRVRAAIDRDRGMQAPTHPVAVCGVGCSTAPQAPDVETKPVWPTMPGVQPVSVSHSNLCNAWAHPCPPTCTAPDRRSLPYDLRDFR